MPIRASPEESGFVLESLTGEAEKGEERAEKLVLPPFLLLLYLFVAVKMRDCFDLHLDLHFYSLMRFKSF